MVKFRKTLGDRMILLCTRGNVVSEVDGIGLVDLRKRGDTFQRTMEHALALIREHDSRRYARVRKQIRWIINQVSIVALGMDYNPRIRACTLEFSQVPGVEPDALGAAYAWLLIQAATQGVILSHGIQREPEFWARVARICLKEGQRFASRLAALDPVRYQTDLLQSDFGESYWRWPDGKSGLSLLSRFWRDRKADPGAAPDSPPPHR